MSLHNIYTKPEPVPSQMQMPSDLYGRGESGFAPRNRNKHDGATYVWLAYSIFFFIEPLLRRSSRYWFHQLPWYLAFLALYVAYVEFDSQAARLTLLAGMFAIGVCDIPRNSGAACFFIYVSAMLPFCVEAPAVLWSVIVIEAATLAVENHLFPGNPFNYLITGFFAAVVGMSNLFVAQSKRAATRLAHAQQENAALSALAERERIARDLHDVLGHTLSVVVLKAELAGRLIGLDNHRALAEINDVERTARTALAEVREAIGGYRSKGLGAEIEQARLTLDAAGVTLHCETQPPSLKARQETVLSLAVREAVTNIVRHARATECSMRFATTPDGFQSLEVADNGSANANAGIAFEGNGLRGMRERVQELGGRFRIEAGQGTRLVIELPREAIAGGKS